MGRRKKTEETNPEVNNNTNIPEENTSEVNSETTTTNPEPAIQMGSRVKIKSGVSSDMMGRRIHNGIKNYVYTVLAVRSDDYCTIECLTYVLTLHKNDLILVE